MNVEKIEIAENFLVIRDKSLILKLRSLGAGVEEGEETRITFLEAAYFADRKVLPLEKETLLSKAAILDPLANEKYYVIKYLRDRGYIVRPSLDGTGYLRLHRKGYRPGEDKTYYLIEVVPKGWFMKQDTIFASLDTAGRLRKELVVAIADTDAEKPLFIKFGRATFE